MRTLINIFFSLFLITLFACSTSQQTTDQADTSQDDEIYVFDDAGISDSADSITNVPIEYDTADVVDSIEKPVEYIVQLGAFTTRDRAETFVKENQSKVNGEMSITFSERTKLYTVQLPPFSTRGDAEIVRDELRLIPIFYDAWIVPEDE